MDDFSHPGIHDVPKNIDELEQHVGQVVPFHFDSGILALSFAVSLVGAACTLELFNRRTSRKGRYNQLLLLGASISMGGIAIWCMHYIGNRATVLLNGEPQVQISYSVGITTLSFFVPILVLLVAFYVVTYTSQNRLGISTWWRIIVSGTLAGGAISGMHYIGNAAISNYRCTYAVANVAGSVVIAVAASMIALALFSVFKAAWASSWWKRLICAVVLAGAVSGMHWCAALGTEYHMLHLLHGIGGPGSATDKNAQTTVIVVSCLSVGACFVMAGSAIYQARVRRRYASKAQRITLAAVVFDQHGRILVTPDGLLPSEEITSTFLQKTQHDGFSTAHPLFHWVFQASRNWSSIVNLIDKMKQHLTALQQQSATAIHGHDSHHQVHPPPGRRGSKTGGIQLVDDDGHFIKNYETVFRELFCIASAQLARKMNNTLCNAGILWDEIISTGGGAPGRVVLHGSSTGGERSSTKGFASESSTIAPVGRDGQDLAEKGMSAYNNGMGQGSLLFLVRRVDSAREIDKLEASGHLFAEVHQVVPIISSTMQIRANRIEEKLRSMANYGQGERMLEPGVHVGLFAIRARVDVFQFDIMVRKQARSLLPSVQIPHLDRIEPAHLDFLRTLNGLSLSAVLVRLRSAEGLPEQETKFAKLFLDAVANLRQVVHRAHDMPVFDEARLLARVVQVPCNNQDPDDNKPKTCSFISFNMMIPIHEGASAPDCEFIPLQFFKTQQLVYKNSPHHAAFARSVHREMSPVLNSLGTGTAGHTPTTPTHPRIRKFKVPSFLSMSPRSLSSNFSRIDSPPGTAPHHVSTSRERMAAGSLYARSEVSLNPTYSHHDDDHDNIGPTDTSAETSSLHDQPIPPSSYAGNIDTASETHRGSNSNAGGPSSSRNSLPSTNRPSSLPPPSPDPSLAASRAAARQQQQQQSFWGGIMVSQEVTVDVEQHSTPAPPAASQSDSTTQEYHHPHHQHAKSGASLSQIASTQSTLARSKSIRTIPLSGDDYSDDKDQTIMQVHSVSTKSSQQSQGSGGLQDSLAIHSVPSSSYENHMHQPIELKEMLRTAPPLPSAAQVPPPAAPLGVVGHSRVEVKKEGDVAATFVDDLFAACIDAPRGQGGRDFR